MSSSFRQIHAVYSPKGRSSQYNVANTYNWLAQLLARVSCVKVTPHQVFLLFQLEDILKRAHKVFSSFLIILIDLKISGFVSDANVCNLCRTCIMTFQKMLDIFRFIKQRDLVEKNLWMSVFYETMCLDSSRSRWKMTDSRINIMHVWRQLYTFAYRTIENILRSLRITKKLRNTLLAHFKRSLS